ncbi:MAG: hypothetical protein ACI4SE_02540 [Lachnospiraceae bacterium]
MRTKKGEYGYIRGGKKRTAFYTLFCLGISLALFFVGWYTTGTKKNLLTIVAVLGCLPASKSMVNMIMFLKAKGCPGALYEQIKPHIGNLLCLFDLQMTSYERTFQIDSLVIEEKNICGVTSNPKCKPELAEKHIRALLEQNGFKDYTVKIFTDTAKYTARMDQLQTEESHANPEVIQLMKDISL